MELEGAKRCFQNLKKDGIRIDTFISDRHRVIITWMQNDKESTNYFFHIWHVARNITKKLMQASKEKGFEIIGKWIRAVCNHIYWAATTTKSGYGELYLINGHHLYSLFCILHRMYVITEDNRYRLDYHTTIY